MRIALVGDSHSQALWPRLRAGLEAAGHTVVLSEANPGWSEAKYVSSGNLQTKLQGARPDLVVFELGGNNQKLSEATYRNDVTALVQAAKATGASVLWFGPPVADATRAPSTSQRHETTANLQSSLLPGLDVSWVDSRPFTRSGHRSDGVHFDAGGYTAWAKAMLPHVLHAKAQHMALLWAAVGGVSLLGLALVLALKRRRRPSQ